VAAGLPHNRATLRARQAEGAAHARAQPRARLSARAATAAAGGAASSQAGVGPSKLTSGGMPGVAARSNADTGSFAAMHYCSIV
jgi:hypothetical protein